MEFITLTFEWSLVYDHMTLRVDRLYYEHKELRYRCLEEEGNNIHVETASILKSDLHVGGIPFLVIKAMITRVLDYVDLKTSLEVN